MTKVVTRRVVSYAREAPIEEALVAEGKRLGIRSLKLALRHDAGWPDRLWLLDRGRTWWTELKAPGKEAHPISLQAHRINYLQSLGHDANWFNDQDAAIAALRERVG